MNIRIENKPPAGTQGTKCHELMSDGSPCPFEKYSGLLFRDQSHCVFHSNMVLEKRTDFEKELRSYVEKIKSDPNIKKFDFTRYIFPEISFQGQQFEKPSIFLQAKFVGNADFSRVVFHDQVNFDSCDLTGGGTFNRAKFLKTIDFSRAEFGRFWFDEAEFIEESIFKRTKFKDAVDFFNAAFNNGADFSNVVFEQQVSFAAVTFKGNVVFSNTEFRGRTLFLSTLFRGISGSVEPNLVDFSEAHFLDEITFNKAEFDNEARFSGVKFEKEVYFYSTMFKGNVDFLAATFNEKTLFAGGGETKVFFAECYFPRIRLGKEATLTFEDVDLSNAVFLDTNIEPFVFRNVSWHETRSRKRALLNEFPPIKGNESEGEYESIAENYRQLVLNYERKRDYEAAEDFHIGEMEMRRKKLGAGLEIPKWLRESIKFIRSTFSWVSISWLGGVYNWLKDKTIWIKKWVNSYQLYGFLSNYGTSYWRAFGVLMLFVLVFSWFFLYSGIQTSETRSSGTNEVQVDTIEYDVFQNEDHSFVSLGQWFSDYLLAIQLTMSIITFQRERFYEPIGALGRFLLFAAVIVLASQAALVLLVIRRRFKR